ncbi:MAG: hypothetical protein M3Z92_05740 [Bacteroidota bacterium]|nr:hypothetical protein [Bacteroidota bacterium]
MLKSATADEIPMEIMELDGMPGKTQWQVLTSETQDALAKYTLAFYKKDKAAKQRKGVFF